MWLTSAGVLFCCLELHAYVGVIDATSVDVEIVSPFYFCFLQHALKSVVLSSPMGSVELIRFCWERFLSVLLDCFVVFNRVRLFSNSCFRLSGWGDIGRCRFLSVSCSRLVSRVFLSPSGDCVLVFVCVRFHSEAIKSTVVGWYRLDINGCRVWMTMSFMPGWHVPFLSTESGVPCSLPSCSGCISFFKLR